MLQHYGGNCPAAPVKNSNNIYLTAYRTMTYTGKIINLANYSKLCVLCDTKGRSSSSYGSQILMLSVDGVLTSYAWYQTIAYQRDCNYSPSQETLNLTAEFSLVGTDSSGRIKPDKAYLSIRAEAGDYENAWMRIYKIWLE